MTIEDVAERIAHAWWFNGKSGAGDVLRSHGLKDIPGLRPMETAPQNRPILALTGDLPDERWSYLSRRWFVIWHLGRGRLTDVDLGWSLFPGLGCRSAWFKGWVPLPEIEVDWDMVELSAESPQANMPARLQEGPTT